MMNLDIEKLKVDGNVFDTLSTVCVKYIVGSSYSGYNKPDKEYTMDMFEEIIFHYFFDWDFYRNYCEDCENYKQSFVKEVFEPFLADLDTFFRDYIVYVPTSPNGRYVALSVKEDFERDEFVYNFLKNSKLLNESVRNDYFQHTKEYSGKEISFK